MTSEAHLIDTSLFRRAILVPVITGLLLMIVAGVSSNDRLTLCLAVECFGNFFSLFKFQFAVMGLAIPLGALVASHHRSMQSAAQIKAQLNQNIFSNYIDHKKLFEQFFLDNNPLELRELSNRQIWEIYDRVFPSAAYGDLSPNPLLENFINDVADHFREITNLVRNELCTTTLDLRNSRIPQEWVNTNFMVSDFLGIPRPVAPNALRQDPVNLLDSYADFTLSLVKGLRDCANFHKFFQDFSAIPRLENDFLEIKDDLEALLSINDARKKILNALENATDASGHLNAKDEYASQSLSRRLEEFTHEQNTREYIHPEFMKAVFENYIPDSHKKVFLDHIPANWKKVL